MPSTTPLVQEKLWNTRKWPTEEESSEPDNPLTEELIEQSGYGDQS
jgi:hypothetical protein